MQKWIRDRMRRRKKKTPDSGSVAQTPLQPNYPEIPEAAVETPEPEEAPVPTAAQQAATPAPRPRRRRKKKAPSAPPEQTAVATEEISPVESVPDIGEEAPSEAPLFTAPPAIVEAPAETPAIQASVPSGFAAPAPARSLRPPRASKGAVVLAVGLPGSGKSTWYKRRGVTPLSSDMVRQLLFDNPTEQRHQDLVFGTLRSLLRARLISRMPMNYVDATNLSPKERRHWIKMARDFGYEVQAVYFDVPLDVCMDRNQRRNRVVPEDVMQRMAAKLKPPTFDEGFSKIIVVRVKQRAPEASIDEPAEIAAEEEGASDTE